MAIRTQDTVLAIRQDCEVQAVLGFLQRGLAGMTMLVHRNHPPGMGLWNGFGGSVEQDECAQAAIRREAKEELGIHDLHTSGVLGHLCFLRAGVPWFYVDTFNVHKWEGKPWLRGPEHARIRWVHGYKDILYQNLGLWPDDQHWLPYTIVGKRVWMLCNFRKSRAQEDRYMIDEIRLQVED